MRGRRRLIALVAVGVLGVLAWPGPAGADTDLGGYDGSAQAIPLRVQIYEPVIPIPASPQIDGGIGLTRVTTDTGPVSRGLASYLWPGDVIGDGFSQLVGGNATYPVQVNSRYPATPTAPATNTAQLTKGNGMSTSSSTTATTATVDGAGIAGPDTDLLGGIGQGLGQLTGQPPASSGAGTTVPVPISGVLGQLATVNGLHSDSSVTLASSSVTSTAHATLGTVSLLGGLIGLNGVTATSTTTSDGTTAKASGSATLGSISVAGQTFSFGDKGLTFGGGSVQVPSLPSTITNLLQELGIQLTTFTTTNTAQGATGTYDETALQLTVDTGALKQRLGIGAVLDTLGSLLAQIPNIGSELQSVLQLGPKFVITLGDVETSTTAAAAYDGGTGGTSGTASGSSGTLGTPGTAGTPGSAGAIGTAPVSGSGAAPQPLATTSYQLPGLGAVPKALILGGVAAALLVAWLLSTVGPTLFAAAGGCSEGAGTVVPNLREG